MKIWKFEVKEGKNFVSYYKTSEAEANTFASLLDESGDHYTMVVYPSLHILIKNMTDWNNDSVSDGVMLDEVIDLIYKLGF